MLLMNEKFNEINESLTEGTFQAFVNEDEFLYESALKKFLGNC